VGEKQKTGEVDGRQKRRMWKQTEKNVENRKGIGKKELKEVEIGKIRNKEQRRRKKKGRARERRNNK
jgi:hypothetical protein